LHDEEAATADGQIGGRGRVAERALGRDRVADVRVHTTGIVGAATGRQDQRRELRRRLLVSGRRGIGDIVADRAQTVSLGIHAGHAGSHGSVEAHLKSSLSLMSEEYAAGLAWSCLIYASGGQRRRAEQSAPVEAVD